MKLDEFVSQTLKQIVDGVSTAQEYSKSKNASINPSTTRIDGGKGAGYSYCYETGIPLQDVEFDVAVTVKESNTTSDGDSNVGSISVTSQHQATNQSSSVSRIKFKVPVLLPRTE